MDKVTFLVVLMLGVKSLFKIYSEFRTPLSRDIVNMDVEKVSFAQECVKINLNKPICPNTMMVEEKVPFF